MNLNLTEINWLAVAVAALATFFLGGLWYTVLFGKQWAALQGYTPERIKALQAKRPPAVFFGCMLICYTIVAIVIAVLTGSFGITTAAGGAALGVVLWVLTDAIGMTGHIAQDRHHAVFAIDSIFQLIYLVGSGAIIAGWR